MIKLDIPEHTELKRSEEYIKTLREWAGEIDSYFLGHRGGDFPANEPGDIVLILNPKSFYEPYLDAQWPGGGHVARRELICSRELELTAAQVVGYSDMNYYAPHLECDLKLKCADGEERFFDAYHHPGEAFVFLPHPDVLDKFRNLLQFLPGFFRFGKTFYDRIICGNEMVIVENILLKRYKRSGGLPHYPRE